MLLFEIMACFANSPLKAMNMIMYEKHVVLLQVTYLPTNASTQHISRRWSGDRQTRCRFVSSS